MPLKTRILKITKDAPKLPFGYWSVCLLSGSDISDYDARASVPHQLLTGLLLPVLYAIAV
jgi:hypothetical protein